MIRYDNLTPAVIRVLLGRDRWENERFIGLRSHYDHVPVGSPVRGLPRLAWAGR
jgi:hypothetical protein